MRSATTAALALLPATRAIGHAILVESRPAEAARLPPGAISFWLRYNSRVDPERSRLSLRQDGAAPAVLPQQPSGRPDVLQASATLTPGSYTLRWQVLAVDGHITRGDVHFTVTTP